MIDNKIKNILENIVQFDQLYMQASSLMKFQKASDGPTTKNLSTSLHSNIAVNQAYAETADSTSEWLKINEIVLGEIEDLTLQAHNLVLTGMPDVMDLTSLQEIKTKFESILYQVIDLANSKYNDTYLFAGTNNHTEPFTLNASQLSVTYNGDDGEIIRSLGPSERVIININGRTAFTNLFTSLIRGINSSRISELARVAEELQNSLDPLNIIRTTNGVHLKQVLVAREQCEETDFLLQTLLSLQDDVSILEAITILQQQEVVYQTVLEITTRTLTTIKLFDLT